jgi:hypothetical protein
LELTDTMLHHVVHSFWNEGPPAGRGIAAFRGGARHQGENETWQDKAVAIKDQQQLSEAREKSSP